MIKVFGHLSPDTDTTCSAIVWAWYLTKQCDTAATPFVLGSLNTETAYVLSRFNVPVPDTLDALTTDDTVVIVDTNNPQELPDTISNATISHIIDHHKLVGGLSTDNPISITMRPVACTATIIYKEMGIEAAQLPTEISGCILAAIISDTLGFRSPTTTPEDTAVATELATALGIDTNSLAEEMFAAKSDISQFTDSDLITLDSKKFALGEATVRVSVLETTAPETVLARKEGIIAAITDLCTTDSSITDVLFFVVDILQEEATVLTYNDFTRRVITASFNTTTDTDTDTDTITLPGIVSRKKQIIPVLTS